MILKPGLYPDLDADVYFADPAPSPSLRQSLIPDLLKRSPRHAAYGHPRLNPYDRRDNGSKAAFIGSTVHRLALGKGREVSIIKFPDWKSQTARERRDEAIRNKRIPVLERDYLSCVEMADKVREAVEEACGGEPYITEVPFFWEEQTPAGPIWCAGMADVFCERKLLILDPKTSAGDATPEAFGPEAARNGYDLQAATYLRGFGAIFPEHAGRFRFANVVVEKNEPCEVGIFGPGESTRYIAERQVQQGIDLWGQCLHTRSWPSYPRQVQTYETPAYYQNQILAAELEE